MSNIQLSYACINMSLRKAGVYTNRTVKLKNFNLVKASELALQNLNDLLTIIKWNEQNGFNLFRISSNLFPRWDLYQINDLTVSGQKFIHTKMLEKIGKEISKTKMRVSFHPDHFTKLAAQQESILQHSISEIERHSHVFDLMGLTPSVFNKINIHVGGAYENKKEALKRFCNSFKKLSKNAQKRLTVENDDKLALFSVRELYDSVHKEIGIPIVFDYHHHRFNTGNLSQQEAFELAYSTWPKDIVPIFHYSESKNGGKAAHSDYISTDNIQAYGKDLCIIVEAKAKELAVLKYF
jgi:UV DNA damage endonuclease